MADKPTLVIMAAGMGSRFGGLKQVEKMTQAGEIILDFSLYDAMMAGFDRAIFVIREEHRDLFRELVDERAGRFMEIEYAYQDIKDVPEEIINGLGEEVIEEIGKREKPWGTGHAIYACRDLINGPFAVINADDYYGPSGFVDIYDFLEAQAEPAAGEPGEAEAQAEPVAGESGEAGAQADPAAGQPPMQICMAGYMLRNTITENGHVARGVCQTDEQGYLTSIVERTKIMQRPEGISFTEDEGESWELLPEDTLVSMNFWGLPAGMMDAFSEGLCEFFQKDVPANPLKSEYLLPTVIDELIKEKKATVKVMPCREKWSGVTYKEDAEDVKQALQSKKDSGLYPEKLWK